MRTIVKKAAITGVVLSTLVFAPLVVHAVDDSEVTTINALIGSTISVTTSTTINLNVTPIIGGAQTSAADTVTVATNNAAGYVLTLANTDSNTSLVSGGGGTIDAHTGTQAASSVLANNSWGYHVDSVGDFGADGAAESNVASSTIKYAGVPANGAADTIRNGAGVTAGEVTTVYYAVKADTSKPNGTYTDTVTYTATTN